MVFRKGETVIMDHSRLSEAVRRIGVHDLFQRYPGNPILEPAQLPYPATGVFNPGAARVGDETILLLRVEDHRGFSHLTVARSSDGLTNWRINAEPTLEASPDHHEDQWGIEDPRIVWLDEERSYAVTYVSFTPGGPTVSLAKTRDFRDFQRVGRLMPPEDKDASLLPRRIGGRHVLIHRPIVRGEAHMWISFSPDLKHWGDHSVLLPTRPHWWDGVRVGLGAPPIETPEGWLLIYHGVRMTASVDVYRVGLALLDLEEPWRVRCRSPEWVLGPQESYELIASMPGVLFPTGAIWDRSSDQLIVYYGAGDHYVAAATARMRDVLDYVLQCPVEK